MHFVLPFTKSPAIFIFVCWSVVFGIQTSRKVGALHQLNLTDTKSLFIMILMGRNVEGKMNGGYIEISVYSAWKRSLNMGSYSEWGY